jgi:hypothetical protein
MTRGGGGEKKIKFRNTNLNFVFFICVVKKYQEI